MGIRDSNIARRLRPNAEQTLILLFFILSLYAFYETRVFSWEGSVFPLITSGIVIIGCVLLLLQNYLPAPLAELTSDSVQMAPTQADEEVSEITEKASDTNDKDSTEESVAESIDRPVSGTSATIWLATLYVIVSYAVGILWATPVFALVYTVWFRLPWPVIIIVTAFSGIAAYTFMTMLNLSIESGALLSIGMGVLG